MSVSYLLLRKRMLRNSAVSLRVFSNAKTKISDKGRSDLSAVADLHTYAGIDLQGCYFALGLGENLLRQFLRLGFQVFQLVS